MRRQRGPSIQAVVDGARNRAALGHAASLQAQPHMQLRPQRLGAGLPHCQPLIGGQVLGLALDAVDQRDALHRLQCHRALVDLDQLVELAPRVRQAARSRSVVLPEHALVAPELVAHQRARPAVQERGRVLGAPANAEVLLLCKKATPGCASKPPRAYAQT